MKRRRSSSASARNYRIGAAMLPAAEPCTRCGREFVWRLPADGARVCEHCLLKAEGHTPRGVDPATGREPELARWGYEVHQRCVECDRFHPLASTDATGRCWYCALPGDDTTRGKVHHGVLTTRDGLRLAVDGAGLVAVTEHDQLRGELGARLVTLGETPRWGTGWAVRTLDGEDRWWLTAWDSSD